MTFQKSIRIALGLPWYAGPDIDCLAQFLAFQHYLGRLQERSYWRAALPAQQYPNALPPLDRYDESLGAEFPDWLEGVKLEFEIIAMCGVSLPGMARERVIDYALQRGCDYVFFWDDDMLFEPRVLLKLLAHQKPVCAALAFTAREPIAPVVYSFREYEDRGNGFTLTIDPLFDYQRDTLQKVDAVGFGVVLVQTSVFRRLPKPWFNNPGVGEDIQFCVMCRKYGIEVWVDTAQKAEHKPRFHKQWHNEEMYLEERAKQVDKGEDPDHGV